MAAKRRTSKAKPSVLARSSTVSRWGNSLGVRIPLEAAAQLKLRAGERVRVEVRSGSLTVTPIRKKWTEAELLAGITPEMVKGEVDWGGPVGREVW
jgi:antitoxin MazE